MSNNMCHLKHCILPPAGLTKCLGGKVFMIHESRLFASGNTEDIKLELVFSGLITMILLSFFPLLDKSITHYILNVQ